MTVRPLDALALGSLTRRAGVPWWARAWWPVLTLVGFLALAFDTPDVPCTAVAPCAAEPVWNAGFGLVLAGAALTAVSGWGAVLATVLGLLLTAAPDDPTGLWAAALVHVGVQAAIAHRRTRTPRTDVRAAGPTGALLVPDVPRPPRVSVGIVAAAAGSLVLVGLGAFLQAHAQAAQDAAPVVGATVLAQDEEDFTVRLALTTGEEVVVDVLDTADHPVGSTTSVWRFEDGSVRPVGEPYDAWGATTGAGLALGLLLVAAARLTTSHVRRRTFLAAPQPVWRAQARLLPGVALIHPLDAAPDDEPVLAVPLLHDCEAEGCAPDEDDEDRQDDWRDEDGQDEDGQDEDGQDDEEPPDPVPVELAGTPLPGHWCAVRVEGRWCPAAEPALAGVGGPPLVVPAVRLDEDGLPLLEVPTADLAAWDVVPLDGPVTDAGEHRVPAWAALLSVAPAVLVTAFGLDWTEDLVGGFLPRPVVAAVLGLIGLELAWRFQLRPRLAWDAAGAVLTGPTGPGRRYGWESLVEVDVVPKVGLSLTLVTDLDAGRTADREFPVRQAAIATAAPWLPAPVRGSWRTAPELRAALLQARDLGRRDRRAVETTGAPARPALLWVVWCAVVAASWLGGWV